MLEEVCTYKYTKYCMYACMHKGVGTGLEIAVCHLPFSEQNANMLTKFKLANTSLNVLPSVY